jgi:hypothetical protein
LRDQKKGDQFVLRESVTEVFSGDDFGVEGAGSEASSLVFSSNNSARSPLNCERWILIEGRCEHENKRFRIVPCGRRVCAYCGPIGRWRIAERIAFGVRQFWPAAWLVLTWATPEAEESAFKKKAVRQVNEFLRKLFRERGVKRLPVAKTWELTGRGRLHCNLIVGNWKFVKQKRLQELWGARVWVERVKESERIGREVAKAYSPEGLGGYLAKLEQAVPVDWGRRCSFSREWPKLPKSGIPRLGDVIWRMAEGMSRVDFFREAWTDGGLVECEPGEYANHSEDCMCFVRSQDPDG